MRSLERPTIEELTERVRQLQVLRRHVGMGALSPGRGSQLLELAAELPAHRHPHETLARAPAHTATVRLLT